MAIIAGYAIAFLAAAIAYQLGEGKSGKRKYVIWGITIMLAISPSLSFSISLTLAVIVGSGWAAMMMWYLFPIGFLTGLIMLIAGMMKKEESEEVS